MKCWEYKKCPEEIRNNCPAYPSRGEDCWKVTGTKCDGGRIEKASLEEKIIYCRKECEFYRLYAHKF